MDILSDSNSGVYAIVNKDNGKLYIGSTNRLNKRDNEHWSDLSTKTHDNQHLQNAFNKYGRESFEYYVIFQCKEEDLLKYEQFFMDFYDVCHDKFGYNIIPRADRTVLSEETIAKMRVAQKGKGNGFYGRKHSQEAKNKIGLENSKKKRTDIFKRRISTVTKGKNNPFYGKTHSRKSLLKMNKPVLQYNKQNELIKEYPSLTSASKKLGCSISVISDACLGNQKTAAGFIWKFKEKVINDVGS